MGHTPTSTSDRVVRTWGPTLLFNIALPIATYLLLTGQGAGTVPALAVSGVWPLAELLYSMIRRGHADEFSVFALVLLVLGIATSLLFDDPRWVLIKDSAITGLFGLVLLGSLVSGRPLMFYFGRKFATDGSPERIEWWNGLWQYGGFRRGQRMLTLVWGTAFLAEAVLRIGLSFVLSVSAMVMITNVLPYVVLAALIFGTIRYGKKRRAAMESALPQSAGPTMASAPPAGAIGG